ncbi:MAG: glutamate 5-kinase [bacterium]|nr:glutamate 5-kinase [bacterium]
MYNRIVIKIGTNLLDSADNVFNRDLVDHLADQIEQLHRQGKQILIVTSGAIGAGMRKLGWKERPKLIPDRQALAAVGQSQLMHLYEEIFGKRKLRVAQVLLTESDMNDRKRYLNARTTLLRLLALGVIPIINENDTVAIEELKIGDNDTLSARVASKVEADLLVILTDVDGLFDRDPRKSKQAKIIHTVEKITAEVIASAEGAGSIVGTGGMVTKLAAAKIATTSGTTMYIVNGNRPNILLKTVRNENIGTKFLPQKRRKLSARERWIAYGGSSAGNRIYVDGGAKNALVKLGKSLLPSGIFKVEGTFEPGDVVQIADADGTEFARGLANYPAEEVQKIKGLKSSQVKSVLGYKYYDEVIHRDNLVLLNPA